MLVDHKTLEYMEERVQKGKFLEKTLEGLREGRRMLDSGNVEFLNVVISDRFSRLSLSDKVPVEILCKLLKESLAEGLDKAIDKVHEEYAKL